MYLVHPNFSQHLPYRQHSLPQQRQHRQKPQSVYHLSSLRRRTHLPPLMVNNNNPLELLTLAVLISTKTALILNTNSSQTGRTSRMTPTLQLRATVAMTTATRKTTAMKMTTLHLSLRRNLMLPTLLSAQRQDLPPLLQRHLRFLPLVTLQTVSREPPTLQQLTQSGSRTDLTVTS